MTEIVLYFCFFYSTAILLLYFFTLSGPLLICKGNIWKLRCKVKTFFRNKMYLWAFLFT